MVNDWATNKPIIEWRRTYYNLIESGGYLKRVIIKKRPFIVSNFLKFNSFMTEAVII